MGAAGPATIVLPHRGWLFDLDGTVYRGDALIPGADGAIAALRAAGRRVAFLSNKPLQTRADYARKLTGLGIPTREDDVVNSSLVLARHLARLDPGAPVFVIGEPPLIAELRAHGFEVRGDPRVRWVVIAFDRTFDYAKLNTALQAARPGDGSGAERSHARGRRGHRGDRARSRGRLHPRPRAVRARHTRPRS